MPKRSQQEHDTNTELQEPTPSNNAPNPLIDGLTAYEVTTICKKIGITKREFGRSLNRSQGYLHNLVVRFGHNPMPLALTKEVVSVFDPDLFAIAYKEIIETRKVQAT